MKVQRPVSSYIEKLRDPRWQKKRLEILSRDDWSCLSCGDKTKTLNVHHIRYERGKDPWDYDNSILRTLCEDCHESVTGLNKHLVYALGRLEESDQWQVLGYIEGLLAVASNRTIQRSDRSEHLQGVADAWSLDRCVSLEEKGYGLAGVDLLSGALGDDMVITHDLLGSIRRFYPTPQHDVKT